jgi:hypothetical protein
MAKRRPARSDDHPRSTVSHYRAGDDGPLLLVYNARGGIYRAAISVTSKGEPVPTAEPAAEGEPVADAPAPKGRGRSAGLKRAGAPEFQVLSHTLLPGLNLVGKDTLTKLSESKGLAQRIADGEILDLGEVAEWPDIKPARAIDYVKTTANVEALRAVLEVELRDEVAKVIERQIAEVTSDGGTRLRARRQAQAHVARE